MPVDLIREWATVKVSAKQDPSLATSLGLVAHGTGTPANLLTLDPGGGVDFVVDGTVIDQNFGYGSRPFPFNSKRLRQPHRHRPDARHPHHHSTASAFSSGRPVVLI